MTIVGYYGNLSGGKTLSAVKDALESQNQTGRIIVTNLRMKGCNSKTYTDDELIQFLQKNFQNEELMRKTFGETILLLDEITLLIDARRSNSNLNSLLTLWFMQLHKIDCSPILFTSQVPKSMVDLRLRDITNAWWNCKKISTRTGKPIISDFRIIDEDFLIENEGVLIDGEREIPMRRRFDPKPYYNKYDTRQILLLDRDKYLAGRR